MWPEAEIPDEPASLTPSVATFQDQVTHSMCLATRTCKRLNRYHPAIAERVMLFCCSLE